MLSCTGAERRILVDLSNSISQLFLPGAPACLFSCLFASPNGRIAMAGEHEHFEHPTAGHAKKK
jgi:hypothetical protein